MCHWGYDWGELIKSEGTTKKSANLPQDITSLAPLDNFFQLGGEKQTKEGRVNEILDGTNNGEAQYRQFEEYCREFLAHFIENNGANPEEVKTTSTAYSTFLGEYVKSLDIARKENIYITPSELENFSLRKAKQRLEEKTRLHYDPIAERAAERINVLIEKKGPTGILNYSTAQH